MSRSRSNSRKSSYSRSTSYSSRSKSSKSSRDSSSRRSYSSSSSFSRSTHSSKSTSRSRSARRRRNRSSDYSRSVSRSVSRSTSASSSYSNRSKRNSRKNKKYNRSSKRHRSSSYSRSHSSRSTSSRRSAASSRSSSTQKTKSYKSKRKSSYSSSKYSKKSKKSSNNRSRSNSYSRSRSRSPNYNNNNYKKSPTSNNNNRQINNRKNNFNNSRNNYSTKFNNNNNNNNNNSNNKNLNNSTLPAFQNPFKSKNSRYTYIRNQNGPNNFNTNNNISQISKNNNVNTNNNKNQFNYNNPLKDSYYLNNNNNNGNFNNQQSSMLNLSNVNVNNNNNLPSNGQLLPPQLSPKPKSAILSHLNLNNKAREELEKRKQKAKEEKKLAEEAAAASISSTITDNIVANENKDEDKEDAPAIPITCFTSINDEDDDDDDDDSEDEEEKNKEKQDEFKTSLLNHSNELLLVKKKALDLDEQLEEEEIKKPKPKILKTSVSLIPKTNPKVDIIKKQPILKAGQTPKEREELNQIFIGPKLPANNNNNSFKISVDNSSNDLKNEFESAKKLHNTKLVVETSVNQNQFSLLSNGLVTAELIDHNEQQQSPPLSQKKAINYTKDELAKYENLSKMSQIYAQLNSTNSNGIDNPVTLDQQYMVETTSQQITNSNPNVIEQTQQEAITTTTTAPANQSLVTDSQLIINHNNHLMHQHQLNLIEHQNHLQHQYLHYQLQPTQTTTLIAPNNATASILNPNPVQSTQMVHQIPENNKNLIENAVTLKLNELEGLTTPQDITLIAPVSLENNSQDQQLIKNIESSNENLQSTVQTDQNQNSPTLKNNSESPNAIIEHQVTASNPASLQPQTVILSSQPQQHYQQIQFLTTAQHEPGIIQYANPATSTATNTVPTQQLINLQPLQQFHLNPIQNQLGFMPTTTATHLNHLALAQTNLFLQQQQQQQQLQHQLQQLQQSALPLHFIAQPQAAAYQTVQPQFIQIRPTFQTLSATPNLAQPQIIFNSPFYRILPQ